MHREVQPSAAHYLPGLNRPFAEEVSRPFLRAMQNTDGGWGYTPRTQSCVEATCWALLALGSSRRSQPHVVRGIVWLERAQLRNGAWPTHPSNSQGGWLTAMACLALRHLNCSAESVTAAADWLCNFLPAEATLGRRAAVGIGSRLGVTGADAAYGWSCEARSASAIEPTAAALLALECLPRQALPRKAARRMEYARDFLRHALRLDAATAADAGAPAQSIYASAWALLALRDECHRVELQDRLDWLHRAAAASRGAASVAMAQLALRACGRRPEALDGRLARLYSANQFLNQIAVAALAGVALGPLPAWLARQPLGAVAHGGLLQRV